MHQGLGHANEYDQPQEPVEVFGCERNSYPPRVLFAKLKADRRFESAQDFPQPPPSTHPKLQPSLDFYQQSEGEDWIDGFLKGQNEHESRLEDLPGTFVGMATTLSPSERSQHLEDPRTFNNGLEPFDFGTSDLPTQLSNSTYDNWYNGSQHALSQGTSGRSLQAIHQTFQPSYDTSSSTYDNPSTLTQSNNYFFPTPPQSTHLPAFFDSNNEISGRLQTSRAAQTPRRLQFGSDARFKGPGFMAPPEQETEEALVRRRIDHMECLKPDPSPASTNPPSPMLQKRKHSQVQFTNDRSNFLHQPLAPNTAPAQALEPLEQYEDSEQTPKRRKRIPDDNDSDFEDPSVPTRAQSKRSRASTSKKPTPRRPSSTANPQAESARQRQANIKNNNRQVLTEEQKKTNHIISEQKRRDLIKRGYQGIQLLVPALKNTKTSKGGMLESAADWLDDLLQCKDILAQQLNSLSDHRSRLP